MDLHSAMTVKQLVFMIALCSIGSGCRIGRNFIRTTIVEPIQFASNLDDKLEQHRFRRLARASFESARAVARADTDDYHHEPFSADERCGFIDGYADYLEAGGTGQPPPLPPRKYWKAAYQTSHGQRAVEDWFRGYEYGASMAEASGFRQLVTVPLSDAIAWNTEPYFHHKQPEEKQDAEPVDDDLTEVVEVHHSADTESPVLARLPPDIYEPEQSRF